MTAPRRVVVLGGGGFLGRHICCAFAEDGWDVLAVSRRGSAPPGTRSLALRPPCGPAVGLAQVLRSRRPDVVVNAAGAVWRGSEPEMTASNVALVEELLDALRAVGTGVRLVHLGSVHEHALRGLPPGGSPHEGAGPGVTLYARTKSLATRAVAAAAAEAAVAGVITRVANVLGPGAPPSSLLGNVTARLAAAARRGEECVLELPPLRTRRDFVDARDVAAAVVRTATAQVVGEILDIGRGELVRVADLVAELIRVSGVPTRVVPRVASGAGTAGHAQAGEYDDVATTAACLSLNWRPRYTLHESLTAMWQASVG
ncbi:hypothetical protein ACM01_01415 [Streptomyces viridochromogenes]|uniref:NAD-dependent epimerase/dehydratase domain-containing protein n=1 Tax=Streptomyces viridochromogenes TaxID=1938 RepID=A0A0J7ZMQ9_STRVR|nr:NAD(P)-dependent oxidoreductase [Streptomyces viridochromogenes]KMS77316.1 hypothetical protein ACM01_01415 [Streptomyces viridochromogenes]KOG19039.1 hypothetical protein ADK36_20545 [Streptomyces viridochromogenes]KOG19278.1 hypothetical protein ADK35_20405 [Streptomyces viridochromogenes]